MKRRAFTLIELLIVVAIIAVLAAIAVPNFLEAQVRSKVARAKADMRTYATAIEAYATDWNEYPPFIVSIVPATFTALEETTIPLSTPVAYLTDSMFVEPFNSKQGSIMFRGWDVLNDGDPPDAGQRQAIYGFIPLPDESLTTQLRTLLAILLPTIAPVPPTANDIEEFISARWFLISPGPDTFYEFDRCVRQGGSDTICIFENLAGVAITSFGIIYDPTNGTVSQGELSRTGKGIFGESR